jgi:hypothetical protein
LKPEDRQVCETANRRLRLTGLVTTILGFAYPFIWGILNKSLVSAGTDTLNPNEWCTLGVMAFLVLIGLFELTLAMALEGQLRRLPLPS